MNGRPYLLVIFLIFSIFSDSRSRIISLPLALALAPGFNWTKDWDKHGALVANRDTVAASIDILRGGTYDKAVVLVNRYDGIDLPHDTCRILIFDGKPFSESLIDLYQESCRPDSEATLMRTVRTVEQGMGRSVRGEKDYSVM